MAIADPGVKRYNLALPGELLDEVQQLASKKHRTIVEVIRQFILLGLTVSKILENPEAQLIIREGDRDTKLLPLL